MRLADTQLLALRAPASGKPNAPTSRNTLEIG